MLSNNRAVLDYYSRFDGHEPEHLSAVLPVLRRDRQRPCMFLAGDSSLDNKFWFNSWGKAMNGYEDIIEGKMKRDVCYWLNAEACKQNAGSEEGDWFCLNTSVEATALNDRTGDKLLPQDEFIRDNLTEKDVLMVSIGGNDIALKPTASTVLSMLALTYLSTWGAVEKARTCSCDRWTCTTCAFRPMGLRHFIKLFHDEVKAYVEKLISKTKPRRVVIGLIYFPLEAFDPKNPCWADRALHALSYNSFPQKLQSVIRLVFEKATSQIKIEGTEVIACPLYEILDGKDPKDYVARVEPSVQGGEKMARALSKFMDFS